MTQEVKIMTPQEAAAMLDGIDKAARTGEANMGQIVQACNLAVRSAANWAIQALRRDKTLLDRIDKLEQIMFPGGLPSENAPVQTGINPVDGSPIMETPKSDEQVAAEAEASAATKDRVGADGRPLDPEEAAREAMMDSAIAAQAKEPVAAPAPAGRTPWKGAPQPAAAK